jgi:hypothetical protein
VTRDPLDMRVLGAVRCIDSVARSTITTSLEVRGDGVRVIRNRSGLYIIAQAPGSELYSGQFVLSQPPAPR